MLDYKNFAPPNQLILLLPTSFVIEKIENYVSICRFGDRTDWIGQFDIDNFLSPQGDSDSLPPILDKLDQEGKKIVSFGSWRAWPRKNRIE